MVKSVWHGQGIRGPCSRGNEMLGIWSVSKGHSMKPLSDFKQVSDLIKFVFRNILLLQCVEHNADE